MNRSISYFKKRKLNKDLAYSRHLQKMKEAEENSIITGGLTDVGVPLNKRRKAEYYVVPQQDKTWAVNTPHGLLTDEDDEVMYFTTFEEASVMVKLIR